MTTYGTIPSETQTSSNDSNLKYVSLAKERIKGGLSTRRPWKEMIQPLPHAHNLPTTFKQCFQRIITNLTFFRMNYAIVVLFILFLSLLWHPVSLIVFIVMMFAWLFLYFLRDDPLVVSGSVIDDRTVMMALSLVTVVALFLTNAKVNIIVALAVGLVVVVVHGALRETDDDDPFFANEEGRESAGGDDAKMPLKNAASSSFTLS
ncbi:PRA1 family protein F3 [Alnus glutinosa]|uniref:PRA1 family protein F3 n=1 Tax=Alnus glutinosa TaxID=3517 RepID=UPI002D7983EF|nr:PRA1 family protein F3 [Alnus glutinosa]